MLTWQTVPQDQQQTAFQMVNFCVPIGSSVVFIICRLMWIHASSITQYCFSLSLLPGPSRRNRSSSTQATSPSSSGTAAPSRPAAAPSRPPRRRQNNNTTNSPSPNTSSNVPPTQAASAGSAATNQCACAFLV